MFVPLVLKVSYILYIGYIIQTSLINEVRQKTTMTRTSVVLLRSEDIDS